MLQRLGFEDCLEGHWVIPTSRSRRQVAVHQGYQAQLHPSVKRMCHLLNRVCFRCQHLRNCNDVQVRLVTSRVAKTRI